MTVESVFSRATMPGFLGAVRELPAPAESASALEILRAPASGAAPSYDVLVSNSAARLREAVSAEREMSRAMMDRAGLAWTVSARSLAIRGNDGKADVVRGYKALRRDDTGDVLDVVSDRYGIVQNSEAFAPFDDVIADGGAEYVGAGAFAGGRIVYVQAKLAYAAEVLPGDMVRAMVLLSTGHGGGRSYKGTESTTRVVCMNTLMHAEATGNRLFSIRHTSNVGARVADAGAQIKTLFARAARRVEVYRALAAKPVTASVVNAFVGELIPMPADPKAKRAAENVARKRREVFQLIEGGRGTELPGVRGSVWGMLNAMTEGVDHVWTRRGDSESRLQHIWYGEGATLKARAFDAAVELLKA